MRSFRCRPTPGVTNRRWKSELNSSSVFPFTGLNASSPNMNSPTRNGILAVIGQTNACLLRAQIHDHDAQLHVGRRLLLRTEARGQLIAGVLDPGAQRGRQSDAASPRRATRSIGRHQSPSAAETPACVPGRSSRQSRRGRTPVESRHRGRRDRCRSPGVAAWPRSSLRWRAHEARCPCRWSRPAACREASSGTRHPDVPTAH